VARTGKLLGANAQDLPSSATSGNTSPHVADDYQSAFARAAGKGLTSREYRGDTQAENEPPKQWW